MSRSVQPMEKMASSFEAKDYLLDEDLKNAVQLALRLDQPLLLTGEPGTGKTKLAHKVASDLANNPDGRYRSKPYVFDTKSTSKASDLFYTYDALSHFHRANIRNAPNADLLISEFIELRALGLAIAQSNPTNIDQSKFKTQLLNEPQSSVVLIDEIDKAPLDFTNDLLTEIDEYKFSIKEQVDCEIKMGNDHRILVLMTSNSEKNLPDAFLRRCLFYHIPFPSPERLMEIVSSQLGPRAEIPRDLLDDLTNKFFRIREKSTEKPAATAEFVSWVRILELDGYFKSNLTESQKRSLLRENLSIIVKTETDLNAVRDYLQLI